MTDWMTDWVTDWVTEWVTDWVTDWVVGWPTDWLSDWVTDWVFDWVVGWPTDYCYCYKGWAIKAASGRETMKKIITIYCIVVNIYANSITLTTRHKQANFEAWCVKPGLV